MFTFPVGFFQSPSGILVPSGLIIPYNGTTAPTGWSLFTSADGRFIIGAGNTFAVGATGGNTSLTTGNSGSQGSHTGSQAYSGDLSGVTSYVGTGTAGSHTHTLTYDYTPPYYGLRLIKSNDQLNRLPAKAVMFSDRTLSGLTRFSNGDGKLFRVNSSIGSGGSNTISESFTSSSAGVHQHSTSKSFDNNYSGGIIATPLGSHTHTNAEFTITPNLYRALLSAWTNASNNFNLQTGMFAFWESVVTIPDGWLLCNGSNGTLDLRDYFIQYTDETNDGTKTGNGTISVPDITLATESWTHNHANLVVAQTALYYNHPSYSASHSHTISSSSPTFLPSYYALAIIQLAA